MFGLDYQALTVFPQDLDLGFWMFCSVGVWEGSQREIEAKLAPP